MNSLNAIKPFNIPTNKIGLRHSHNTSLYVENGCVISGKRSKKFTLSTREVGFIFRRNAFEGKWGPKKANFVEREAEGIWLITRLHHKIFTCQHSIIEESHGWQGSNCIRSKFLRSNWKVVKTKKCSKKYNNRRGRRDLRMRKFGFQLWNI